MMMHIYLVPGIPQVIATAPSGLYGFSRLNRGYMGAFVRVRRSSDNAEADCSSEADIVAHCTGTNGFVKTVYDQIGTKDITQATTTLQPKIYDSATGLVKDGGNLAATWDGTDDAIRRTGDAGTFAGDQAWTILTMFKNTDAGANNRGVMFAGARTNSTGDYLCVLVNGSDGKARALGQNMNIEWTPTSLTILQYWVIRKPAGLLSTATCRANSANLTQFALTDATPALGTTDLIWGSNEALGGALANFFQGNQHTLAYWTAAQLAGGDLSALEAWAEARRLS